MNERKNTVSDDHLSGYACGLLNVAGCTARHLSTAASQIRKKNKRINRKSVCVSVCYLFLTEYELLCDSSSHTYIHLSQQLLFGDEFLILETNKKKRDENEGEMNGRERKETRKEIHLFRQLHHHS